MRYTGRSLARYNTFALSSKLTITAVSAKWPVHMEFHRAKVNFRNEKIVARCWRRTWAQRKTLVEEVPRRWMRSGSRYLLHSIGYLGAMLITDEYDMCVDDQQTMLLACVHCLTVHLGPAALGGCGWVEA